MVGVGGMGMVDLGNQPVAGGSEDDQKTLSGGSG